MYYFRASSEDNSSECPLDTSALRRITPTMIPLHSSMNSPHSVSTSSYLTNMQVLVHLDSLQISRGLDIIRDIVHSYEGLDSTRFVGTFQEPTLNRLVRALPRTLSTSQRRLHHSWSTERQHRASVLTSMQFELWQPRAVCVMLRQSVTIKVRIKKEEASPSASAPSSSTLLHGLRP